MYHVLIADDEEKDRHLIRILLERKYGGRFRIFEAASGAEVLETAKHHTVHLLLLDINMPGMTGLEVLRSLEAMPYVIMLTAYNAFAYIQEALRQGVRDYLLKPPSRKEFYQAIDCFLAVCELSQEKLLPQAQSRTIFTRDLAQQLMCYGNEKKILSLMKLLGFSGAFAVCGLLEEAGTSQAERTVVLDEAEEALDCWNMSYAADCYSRGIAVFLFSSSANMAPGNASVLERLQQHLEHNLSISLHLRSGPSAPIGQGYPQVFLEQTASGAGAEADLQALLDQRALEQAIRKRDFSAAMRTLRPALHTIETSQPSEQLKHFFLMALVHCARHIPAGPTEEERYLKVSSLADNDPCGRLSEEVARYIQWLFHCKTGEPTQHSVVQTALGYVCQDCSQPWSITVLSKKLHVNSYYLSHLFKEHTGMCFTDYLAEQRIHLAEQLMQNTNLNLAQIGERVGYPDPNYFSRVFKKHCGIPPHEFSKALHLENQKDLHKNL